MTIFKDDGSGTRYPTLIIGVDHVSRQKDNTILILLRGEKYGQVTFELQDNAASILAEKIVEALRSA